MYFNVENFNEWELEKAVFILSTAKKWGMKINGCGECAVDQTSRYTYLWLKDYDFTLYMPINCDISQHAIRVMWTNIKNGEEIKQSLTDFTDLKEIIQWCKNLINQSEQ